MVERTQLTSRNPDNSHLLVLFFFPAMFLSGAASPATPPLPYALNLLEEYPEYGNTPPPDICDKELRNPCVLRNNVLYAPVVEAANLRSKLSASAWSGLQLAMKAGQETWIFSVCLDKMRDHPDCFAVYGVAVLDRQRAIFYAFFKAKTYPD